METKASQLDYAGLTTRQARPPSHRQRHIAIVAWCGLIDMVIVITVAQIFGVFEPFLIFLGGLIVVIPFLIIATTAALLIRTSHSLFKIGLAILCISPAAVFTVLQKSHYDSTAAMNWKINFEVVLSNPIPKSVIKVDIGPKPTAMHGPLLRFKIAKEDFDQILRAKGFTRVLPGHFDDPRDPWNDTSLLQLGNADEFYQFVDNYSGTDRTINTIRVNNRHSEAILRPEWRSR